MARKDLRAAAAMLDPDIFAEEIFGFHAQQAVEKSLKAWLSLIGRAYPRTHDLGALLEILTDRPENLPEWAWELVDLTDFAVQLRYESFEYDDEALDRTSVISQVTTLVGQVEALVHEGST